jgi:hypothetical protein
MPGDFVKAYACVYRHVIPSRRERRLTEQTAADIPLVRKYLDRYDEPDCFDDWGDDPSFFSATEILGSADQAAWGVCRRDVRARMKAGDFVDFFCGKQSRPQSWDYFYVGVATIGRLLDRQVIWTDDQYAPYRDFLNILTREVDGATQQYEFVQDFHPDWKLRAEAPYLAFDADRSHFNTHRPLWVATYEQDHDSLERWHTEDERVQRLARLVLPSPPTTRRLRSINRYRSHPPLNLASQAQRAGGFDCLRSELLELVAH